MPMVQDDFGGSGDSDVAAVVVGHAALVAVVAAADGGGDCGEDYGGGAVESQLATAMVTRRNFSGSSLEYYSDRRVQLQRKKSVISQLLIALQLTFEQREKGNS